jgi:hypothetical protein
VTTVPKLFPNSTVVCIGAGPSLTPAEVDACRGRAPVVVINNSYKLAPWADVLYAADRKWWDWEKGAPAFLGLKYSIAPMLAGLYPDVQVLRNTGASGLELEPTGLRTGMHSGYQAINLAVHLGAARILLLGYDLSDAPDGRKHWHPDHPGRNASPYPQMLAAFPSLVEPLSAIGVTVVNCSRRTVLEVFPKARLEDELIRLERAA